MSATFILARAAFTRAHFESGFRRSPTSAANADFAVAEPFGLGLRLLFGSQGVRIFVLHMKR